MIKVNKKSNETDKDDYRSTLLILYDAITESARINLLNKIFIATEDPQLKYLLWPVLDYLRYSLIHVPEGKKQKILDFSDPRVMSLVGYCTTVLASKKPQWQIIAEAQGWRPVLNVHGS